MRRTTGPGSITARAVKPLLALAVMLTALATAAAPAMATATPSYTGTAVTSEAPTTGTWNVAPRAGTDGESRVAPDFTCQYFSRYPFQVVDFVCQIRAGVIRVFLVCADGAQPSTGPLPAVGTYNFRLICAGSRVQTINWQSVG